MELGHIVNSDQSQQELDKILEVTQEIKNLFQLKVGRRYLKGCLDGKFIVSLFKQPSTRTKLKFELAGKYLGAEIVVIPEIAYTSVVKGEDWYNTLRTFSEEGVDILTVRHPQNFIPQKLASLCDRYGFKPKIINGGDGNHFHPTQGIGDAYTLKEHFVEKIGRERLKIAIGADLRNARVSHSLVKCLAHYPVELTLVSWQDPKYLMPRKYLKEFIKKNGKPREVEKLPGGEKFDAIYWFRYQIEHGPKNEEKRIEIQKQYNRDFRVTPDFLNTFLKDDGIFLHPGPRTKEINIKIDSDPRVKDGEQIRNGRFSTMALYLLMLNPNFYVPKPSEL